MREGVFLPPRLAGPGMDQKLAGLVEAGLLLPDADKRTRQNGTSVMGNMLDMLTGKGSETIAVSSFFHPLSDEEKTQLEKEKERFFKTKNVTVKTGRFVTRNKKLLLGITAGLLVAALSVQGAIKRRSELPTTKGMDSVEVVAMYYEAFDTLDHTVLEACLMGADKSDVSLLINFYVIDKTRQAYERAGPTIISARDWKENGGELPAPDVFGVTDLAIEHLSGREDDGQIHYLARYTLWLPNGEGSVNRGDELTLTRKKGNWRITEINRTQLFH
jgi:hypothetical protein